LQIGKLIRNDSVFNSIIDCCKEADKHLKQKDENYLLASVFLELRLFGSSSKRILHDFGIVACVGDQSINKGGIFQIRSSQNNVIIGNGDLLAIKCGYNSFQFT
jgi:hypothetical protein